MSKDISLIQIRDRYNLTQEQFADALGVSIGTISKIERGITKRSKSFENKLNTFLKLQNKPVDSIDVYSDLTKLYMQNGVSEEVAILLVTRIKGMTMGLDEFSKVSDSHEVCDKSKHAYIDFLLETLTQMKNITDVKRTSLVTHRPIEISETANICIKAIERKSRQINNAIYKS